ncbi:MAG TPA: hypothetical protein VFH04_03235 [Nitrososphaeraceae archaeon]|nr:hypothetical protein [Nitrososphaeraceae archaeon]
MDINHTKDPFVLARSQCISRPLWIPELVRFIGDLKRAYQERFDVRGIPYEILPLDYYGTPKIETDLILKLDKFAIHNPIFRGYREANILNCQCKIFACDVIEYWLSSKKYDASYQPFYPTWLLSSLILCLSAKLMGFKEIVDIGSGDARIPYCGAILGLRAISVELDSDLTSLQQHLVEQTGVKFEIVNDDACKTNFRKMQLSRPMFIVSALPELGELLAEAVISNLSQQNDTSRKRGFVLMGSHAMKKYARDSTGYGWGQFIARHNLYLLDCLTLPTMWTNEQLVDTPFILSLLKQK